MWKEPGNSKVKVKSVCKYVVTGTDTQCGDSIQLHIVFSLDKVLQNGCHLYCARSLFKAISGWQEAMAHCKHVYLFFLKVFDEFFVSLSLSEGSI